MLLFLVLRELSGQGKVEMSPSWQCWLRTAKSAISTFLQPGELTLTAKERRIAGERLYLALESNSVSGSFLDWKML
jgi:hypothetical protein